MRGLGWLVGLFGSTYSAVGWAFRHADHNPYPVPAWVRNIVSPDIEPPERSEPHPAMAEFSGEDYHLVAGKALADVQTIPGIDWPLLEVAFAQDSSVRAIAANKVADSLDNKYPHEYVSLVCYGWRYTQKIRPSILIQVSGKSESTELRWRADIQEKLAEMFDREIGIIDRKC